MPNVYIFSSTDPKNNTYREELAHSLQREGITIESTLANCQILILLQTAETALLPHVQTLLRSATRLIRQQRLQEIIRFVYEDIEPLPEGWDGLTMVDARENPIAATKHLVQLILQSPIQQKDELTNLLEQLSSPSIPAQGLDDLYNPFEDDDSQRTPTQKLVRLHNPINESNHTPAPPLEHDKTNQEEVDAISAPQDSTQAPLPTDNRSIPEALTNPFEGDDEPTIRVRPSTAWAKKEPVEGDDEPTIRIRPSTAWAKKEPQSQLIDTANEVAIAPSSSVPPPPPRDPLIVRLHSIQSSVLSALIIRRPSSAPFFPQLSQPEWYGSPSRWRRWWFLAVVAIILLIAFLIVPPLFFTPKARPTTPPPAPQLAGYVYFFSSGMVDVTNSQGMNDGLQIELRHIAPPDPGMQYYGWLLPDLNHMERVPIALGAIPVQGGVVHIHYVSATHTDLLAQAAQFLMTEESASLAPVSPSSDRSFWRYYAELPQQPGTMAMDNMHLSFLDHLRHLLVEDPDLATVSAHGGLSLWTMENTRKVLEWANAARGTGIPQGPDLMHRQFIRILDYLDGASYVNQDVPANTPFLVDQIGGHFGLLTINSNQNPPGYLQTIALHLEGMVTSPGATSTERTLAGKIDKALSQTKYNLDQVRQDAIKLINIPENQLQGPAAINILNDLVTQANNAYIGVYDPQTGNRIQGVTWVCDQLQHLAAFEVKLYTPDQLSEKQPSSGQMPTPTMNASDSQMPTPTMNTSGSQMPTPTMNTSGSQMPTPTPTMKKGM